MDLNQVNRQLIKDSVRCRVIVRLCMNILLMFQYATRWLLTLTDPRWGVPVLHTGSWAAWCYQVLFRSSPTIPLAPVCSPAGLCVWGRSPRPLSGSTAGHTPRGRTSEPEKSKNNVYNWYHSRPFNQKSESNFQSQLKLFKITSYHRLDWFSLLSRVLYIKKHLHGRR